MKNKIHHCSEIQSKNRRKGFVCLFDGP